MGNPVIHFEITTKEPEKLQSFYSGAFDWKIDADNPMDYGMVDTGGDIPGGIGGTMDPNYPGHVTFYIQVDDPDAALAKVEELGGKTLMSTESVPGGPTIALFSDPAGNTIGLVKAE